MRINPKTPKDNITAAQLEALKQSKALLRQQLETTRTEVDTIIQQNKDTYEKLKTLSETAKIVAQGTAAPVKTQQSGGLLKSIIKKIKG